MAEISGAARAAVGKSHVAGSADIKVTTVLIGLVIIGAAFVLSWTAAGSSPRRLFWVHQLTEHEGPSQDFREHLATTAELLQLPVFVPVVYPDRTAPGITNTIHAGFATGGYGMVPADIRGGGGQTEPW